MQYVDTSFCVSRGLIGFVILEETRDIWRLHFLSQDAIVKWRSFIQSSLPKLYVD